MKNIQAISVVAVVTLLLAGTAQAELAVIANPANAATALSVDEAKGIYLGKAKSLPGGGAVTPADQKEGSATRTEFYTKVVGKDASQVKAYWSKLIFSGQGTPPSEVGGDGDVKAWVAKTPEGIGYVDKSAVDASVKVLLVVP